MKTDIIVLASGFSRRFQGNKLLYELEGIPLIEHTLRKIKILPAHQIYVVTQYPEVMELARRYQMIPLMNSEAITGQASSIRTGIAHSHSDQVMLIVADQPYIREETLHTLWEKADGKHIVCMSYQGIARNPAIFPRKYYSDLLSLRNEQGGKAVLKKYPQNILMIECSKEELKDIDTINDMEKDT